MVCIKFDKATLCQNILDALQIFTRISNFRRFHETKQTQNEVGRFFYNLAEFVFEYFCDSRRILATFAKFCLSLLFATCMIVPLPKPQTSSSARSSSPLLFFPTFLSTFSRLFSVFFVDSFLYFFPDSFLEFSSRLFSDFFLDSFPRLFPSFYSTFFPTFLSTFFSIFYPDFIEQFPQGSVQLSLTLTLSLLCRLFFLLFTRLFSRLILWKAANPKLVRFELFGFDRKRFPTLRKNLGVMTVFFPGRFL